MVAAALVALPRGGGPGASSLAEGAGFVSAAQAALWKMERERGVPDKEAWTAAANASIALLEAHRAAPPGAILGVRANRTAHDYYRKEERKGIHDPDAVHVDNILDLNAKASARELAKRHATKIASVREAYEGRHIPARHVVEDENTYAEHDLGKMLGKAHGDERGAEQATRGAVAIPTPLSGSPASRAEERDQARRAREIQEEADQKKILAKEEAARKEAKEVVKKWEEKHQVHSGSSKDGAGKQDASSSLPENMAPSAAAAPASPDDEGVTIVRGDGKGVNIVKGTSHLAHPEGDTTAADKKEAAAGGRDTKKAAPGKEAPGMLCLRDGGLNDQELDDFTSSTVCVGWEIKRNIGLGDTVHMIKVSTYVCTCTCFACTNILHRAAAVELVPPKLAPSLVRFRVSLRRHALARLPLHVHLACACLSADRV